VLPAGRLREPVAALARANAILITKVPLNPDKNYLERLGGFLHKHSPNASIGLVRFGAEFLISLSPNVDQSDHSSAASDRSSAASDHSSATSDRSSVASDHSSATPGQLAAMPSANFGLDHQDLQSIAGKRVFAFCALARPKTFFHSLSNFSVTVAGTHSFPDHHWYTRKDLQKLQDEADRLSCDFLLTTEKDLVKLLEFKEMLRQPLLAPTLTTNWVGGIPNYLSELLTAKTATDNDISTASQQEKSSEQKTSLEQETSSVQKTSSLQKTSSVQKASPQNASLVPPNIPTSGQGTSTLTSPNG
jgi:hypothetical protein